MKKTVLFFLAIFSASLAFGQIGIRGSYLQNDAPTWTLHDLNGDPVDEIQLKTGFSVGLDYWFRLKNQRIEFFPEMNYASFADTWDNTLDLKFNMYSFYLNTQIYFLDFAGDCDCPTFSKEGTFVDRGLFLLLSPGYSFQNFELNFLEGQSTKVDNNAFSLGAGLGLDIGVSDAITITPYVGARYFLSSNWEDINLEENLVDNQLTLLKTDQNNYLQIFAGIRLGFRFDEF